jgi:hypothetical protein
MLSCTLVFLLYFTFLFASVSAIRNPSHFINSVSRKYADKKLHDGLDILTKIRGGAKPKKKSKKDIIEEDTFEKEAEKKEVEEDIEGIDDADFDDRPFSGQQNQMVTSITDIWTKTPPITQVFAL